MADTWEEAMDLSEKERRPGQFVFILNQHDILTYSYRNASIGLFIAAWRAG